jgi:hypothetical protein
MSIAKAKSETETTRTCEYSTGEKERNIGGNGFSSEEPNVRSVGSGSKA